jgi:hypothetical protein
LVSCAAGTVVDEPSTGVRREPNVVSYGIELDLYLEVYEEYRNKLNSSAGSSANLTYTIQPIGSAGVLAGENEGGNILGIPRIPQSCKRKDALTREE